MHDWQWKYIGGDCNFPSDTEKGYYTRKCKVCEYEPNDFNAKDKYGNIISWTKDNILIIAENATASKILANDGDKLTLRIMRNADTMGKRCTGWAVEYKFDDDGAIQVANLTDRHTFINNGDDSYSCTVSIGPFDKGCVLIFMSSFADCTEHNYQTVGYRDAVCMKDGYKGDRVCMNCGQYDPNDVPTEEKVIPAAKTEHDGVLLPLFYDKNDKTPTTDRSSGKRYHFKAGSCTATGLKKYKCYVCNIVIREEIQPALGHDWVKDEANSMANITAYKCNRTDCVATKLENVAPEKFDIIITNGTATTAQTDKSGKLSALPAPSRSGYRFNGWYTVRSRSEHGKKLFSGGFFSLKLSGSAAFST